MAKKPNMADPIANVLGNLLGLQVTVLGMLSFMARTDKDRVVLEQILTQMFDFLDNQSRTEAGEIRAGVEQIRKATLEVLQKTMKEPVDVRL